MYTEPAHQIENNLNFQILPQSFDSHGFQELETNLMNLSLYEFMVLETVCSQDPKVKYEFIRHLKLHGLTTKCALLTYSHGNYIGSTHFIWKVCGGDDVLSLSQLTIEKAKKEIPVFHTRAMKRVLL